MVCPTNSGRMVERRDQVRITRRSRERFSSRTFTSRCASTNGPFFLYRPLYINLPSLPPFPPPRGPLRAANSGPDPFTPPLLAPLHDQAVAGLALARLRPQGGLAPRTHRSRHAYRGAPLAATVRVTGRIHGHPAHRRPPPQPALAAGLADLDRLRLGVPPPPQPAPVQPAGPSRASPEGRRRWAKPPSLAMICAPPPAARTSCPPAAA